MSYTVSKHAQHRLQQRCIPEGILDLLLQFGDREADERNGVRVRFTKASIQRLRRWFGEDMARSLGGYFDVYAVISTDAPTVITVSYLDNNKKSRATARDRRAA